MNCYAFAVAAALLAAVGTCAPAEFDWRTFGAVTPVGNLMQASCREKLPAIIAAVAAGATAAKRGATAAVLSADQIMNCVTTAGSPGCFASNASTEVKAVVAKMRGKVATAASYGNSSTMCLLPHLQTGAVILGLATFPSKSSTMMAALVKLGPIAVLIDALPLQTYSGGTLKCPAGANKVDDTILVVGYNTAAAVPYWIVQNSWGVDWGLQGYAHIAMAADQDCGIGVGPWALVVE
jgi:hypothetical protein